MLLNEFNELRWMDILERAPAHARSADIWFVLVVQDLEQLFTTYGYDTPLWGNLRVKIFHAPDRHDGTAKRLSQMLGTQTISVMSTTESERRSRTRHATGRELLTMDEVMGLGPDQVLVWAGLSTHYCSANPPTGKDECMAEQDEQRRREDERQRQERFEREQNRQQQEEQRGAAGKVPIETSGVPMGGGDKATTITGDTPMYNICLMNASGLAMLGLTLIVMPLAIPEVRSSPAWAGAASTLCAWAFGGAGLSLAGAVMARCLETCKPQKETTPCTAS